MVVINPNRHFMHLRVERLGLEPGFLPGPNTSNFCRSLQSDGYQVSFLENIFGVLVTRDSIIY